MNPLLLRSVFSAAAIAGGIAAAVAGLNHDQKVVNREAPSSKPNIPAYTPRAAGQALAQPSQAA